MTFQKTSGSMNMAMTDVDIEIYQILRVFDNIHYYFNFQMKTSGTSTRGNWYKKIQKLF